MKLVTTGIIHPLVRLLGTTSLELLELVTLVLVDLSGNSGNQAQMVGAGAIPRLQRLVDADPNQEVDDAEQWGKVQEQAAVVLRNLYALQIDE